MKLSLFTDAILASTYGADRVIRGQAEFSAGMVIVRLRMKSSPWRGVDKTPVFDSAAGGFVYVYGGTHLNKRRSATLREKIEQYIVESRADKVDSSIFLAGR